MTTLTDLQSWYLQQCNDDWEHQYGISVGTLDNPGWSLTIDLTGTSLSGRSFTQVSYGIGAAASTSDNEWMICKVENDKFQGHGGPEKLEELINVFLTWAKSAA